MTLFNKLQHLSETNDCFLRFDYDLEGDHYVIFSYRIASYTDFLSDSALESRGVMFMEMSNDPGTYKLVSRTPEKFFNINENPFTMNLDFVSDPIVLAMIKEDGSLISSFVDSSGTVRTKSKQSIFSEQAAEASRVLNNDVDLLERVTKAEHDGFTVHMEYCAPDNRIVVSYETARLIVIMARHRDTGEYMEYEELQSRFGEYAVIQDPTLSEFDDQREYIRSVFERKNGTEGVVCRTKSGLFFKVKTEWYASLHHVKDSVSSPRRLFEAILDEGIDDVRSWFADDHLLMQEIDQMENKVHDILHKVKHVVNTFYDRNKSLDRKDYAIKGQQELDRIQFSLAMMKYSGKEADVVGMVRKNYKYYGVADE